METAKQAGRAAFGEMVAYLKAHPAVRVMLVEKTDRLYRNLKDWVTIDELGLEIHFAKEGVVLSRESRSSEKFMHGIKVLMAKNYIDNLSEEARKGMQEKAEQGIWPTIDTARLPQCGRPRRQEDHRPRSSRRPADRQAVRDRTPPADVSEGGGEESPGGWGLPIARAATGARQHGAQDPAQPALLRRLRLERPTLYRAARCHRLPGVVGAGSGRAGRPPRAQEHAQEA